MANKNYFSMPLSNYTPNDAEVQKYLDVWDQLDDYVNQEVALTMLFDKFPNNNDFGEVLIKCTVLNNFYSAGVRTIDLLKMVDHIVSCDIDERLEKGDWSVVEQISSCKGTWKYYSFASKYCNWHNPKNYPIYDSFVDNVLWELNDKKKLFKHRQELKQYSIYGNVLINIAKNNNLQLVLSNDSQYGVNFKILDKYFWLLGKHKTSTKITPTIQDIIDAIKGKVSRTVVDDYVIVRTSSGAIKVTKNGGVVSNTKNELRQISNKVGFKYDEKWNTRQFGKNLIEYINSNK